MMKYMDQHTRLVSLAMQTISLAHNHLGAVHPNDCRLGDDLAHKTTVLWP